METNETVGTVAADGAQLGTVPPGMKRYEVVKNRFDASRQASTHNLVDGACYTVNFYGPGAEEHAREYAAWKNREVQAS